MKNFQFSFFNFQKYGNRGFTMVESVVAAGIFAVAMTSIAAAVLAVMRVDEKSRAIRVVEQNARFVTELFQRELRNGNVNYAGYGGTIPSYGRVTELRLVNAQGEQERFFLDIVSHRIRMEKTTGGTTYTTDLTSANTDVGTLSFYIKPTTDPFLPGGVDQQPWVSFTFQVASNTGAHTRDQISIYVQSTASSRNYPR